MKLTRQCITNGGVSFTNTKAWVTGLTLGLILVTGIGSGEALAKSDYLNQIPDGYEKSCNLCHSSVPALNKFGEDWVKAGRKFTAAPDKQRPAPKPSTSPKATPAPAAKNVPANAGAAPTKTSIRQVNLRVNSKDKRVAALVSQQRFLTPVRPVAALLGGTVDWDPAKKQVSVKARGKSAVFSINSTSAGGKTEAIPVIYRGQAMVPLRLLAETLGGTVNYNPPQNVDIVMAPAEHPGTAYIKANGYAGAKTCLTCHPGDADEVMGGVHYQLAGAAPASKDFNGGSYDIPGGMANRFCGFPAGAAGISWAYMASSNATGTTSSLNSCGTCHVTLGTFGPPNPMAPADPADKDKLDCLICHAEKYPERQVKLVDTPQGQMGMFTLDPAEATAAALTVGKTTSETCMRCHEHGMQGDKYKRLTPWTTATDVHDRAGMECTDCHTVQNHKFAKGQAATDLITNDLPEAEVSCVTCHTEATHKNTVLNSHTQKLACESCHIKDTAYSYYDWSKMVLNPQTSFYEPSITHEPGKISWRWYNGTGTAMANALSSKGLIYPGQKGNPPVDKITPFRGFNSLMPVDKNNPFIILPFDLKLLKETGDTERALQSAMASPFMQMLYSKQMEPMMQQMAAEFNMTYSPGWKGEWEWSPMPMDATISINHAITREGRTCNSCHSPNGVMDWQGLGYTEDEIKQLTSFVS